MNNTKISEIPKFSCHNIQISNSLEGDHQFYLKLVKEYLNLIDKKYYKVSSILDNEDILTDLTTTIMMADLNHNPNKSSKRYWRIKCILWQLNNIFINNKHVMLSLYKEPAYNRTPADEFSLKELSLAISHCINSFNEREALIMNDYYFTNITQSTLAKKHGISQVRINQILAKNQGILRKRLRRFCV